MSTPTVGVIYTEPKRISDLVKKEQWMEWGWCREEVTVNITAGADLVIGDVLGKVTASGKYTPRDPDAATGEEVSAAVVLENVTVDAATDTTVLVAVNGDMILADESLVFSVDHDAGERATAVAELAALNIKTETQLV